MKLNPKENDTGVNSFDYSEWADNEKFLALYQAMNDFVMQYPLPEQSQQEWLQMVVDMASALSYGDCCRECMNGNEDYRVDFPYQIMLTSEDRLQAFHKCPNGHSPARKVHWPVDASGGP